jgi:hypothetical protein
LDRRRCQRHHHAPLPAGQQARRPDLDPGTQPDTSRLSSQTRQTILMPYKNETILMPYKNDVYPLSLGSAPCGRRLAPGVGSSVVAKQTGTSGAGRTGETAPSAGTGAWQPDLSVCVEEIWEFDLGPESKVTISTWYDGRRLAKFAIMHLTRDDDGRMVEIARGDSCDGEAHMHTFDKQHKEVNRKPLLAVTEPEDVARGYDLVYKRVVDQWEADLRRWARGR